MKIIIHTPKKPASPLERMRLERRLSREELAKLTGLSINTIYRLETGRRTTPTDETLRIIADFYGFTPEQIAKMVPPPPSPRTAIKEIRNTKGITGRELAKLSGISYRTFLRAQRGEPVNKEVIERIANILKVAPYVIAPDVFTPPLDRRSIAPPHVFSPPLDPRSITPPRILPEEPHR